MECVPAVFTALAMPCTVSIAMGIGLGCVSDAVLTLIAGLCVVKFAVG